MLCFLLFPLAIVAYKVEILPLCLSDGYAMAFAMLPHIAFLASNDVCAVILDLISSDGMEGGIRGAIAYITISMDATFLAIEYPFILFGELLEFLLSTLHLSSEVSLGHASLICLHFLFVLFESPQLLLFNDAPIFSLSKTLLSGHPA